MKNNCFFHILLLFFLTLGPFAVSPSLVQARNGDEALEYKIKAGFILNFAKFLDWPEKSFENEKSKFVIGVLGKNPFDGSLRKVEEKTVRGREVQFVQITSAAYARGCHLLFISDSERKNLDRILNELKGAPVVVVGNSPQFAERGGTIAFVFNHGHLGFIINNTMARESSIGVPAHLLNLAVRTL